MAIEKKTCLLAGATVQEIQVELIRRTQYNAFDGEDEGQVVVSVWWD